MNRSTHLVDNTELMCYLDGELPVERAAVVASHIEQCAECQICVADLRSVSQQLAAWHVESPSLKLAGHVSAALQEHLQSAHGPNETSPLLHELEPPPHNLRRWVFGLVGVIGSLILIFALAVPNLLKSRQAANQGLYAPVPQVTLAPSGEPGAAGRAVDEQPRANGRLSGSGGGGSDQPAPPMIIRTAGLTLITKEFDKARGEAEAIIRRHQGYSAQLSVSGQAGSGRAMTASFRLPSNQLDATLSELKAIASVDQESQGGEEVTKQFVDLTARLANAQNTENRLNEVLRQNTVRITDILAVENEISRVRGEIERMDAERTNLQNQVQYATLQLQLKEEYKAEIGVPAISTGTLLHNALVDGYRGAFDSVMGLVFFLLTYGPALVFWVLLLFLPARFAWRKVRSREN